MAYGYNRLKSTAGMVNKRTRGMLNAMDRFYLPSIEKASESAERFGQLGTMRSSEDEYRDRMEGNINRSGGNTMASDLDASRKFGVGRFNQAMGANQARFGALSSIANTTLQGGVQGLAQRQQAARAAAAAKAEEDRANAAEREQQRAATGQIVGDVIGTGMDIGMTVATGGAYAPQALANGVKRFGGSGGVGGPPPPQPVYGEWQQPVGPTPSYYDRLMGRWDNNGNGSSEWWRR